MIWSYDLPKSDTYLKKIFIANVHPNLMQIEKQSNPEMDIVEIPKLGYKEQKVSKYNSSNTKYYQMKDH